MKILRVLIAAIGCSLIGMSMTDNNIDSLMLSMGVYLMSAIFYNKIS